MQGRLVRVAGGFLILVDLFGGQSGGDLRVDASESVVVEQDTQLFTQSLSNGNSGNINVTTQKLVVRSGAQLHGQLTINASDSVELIGGTSIPVFRDGSDLISSGLFSATYGNKNAGSITINTGKLRIQGGARISTSSEGIYRFISNQLTPKIQEKQEA